MDRQAFIDWVKEQRYSGKRFKEEEAAQVERLYRSVDRFCAYLREERNIERIEDTSLDALRRFPYNCPENDDEHLRLAFSYLGLDDLAAYMGMVSADKYFRNKKLAVAFRALVDLKEYVPALRKAGIRMASELLEQGGTPEGRAGLAESTGISDDILLQMVNCADLCRMTGMAGQTLRRSVAMSYDTLDKFRAVTPEQIEADFSAHLRATGERTNRMVSFSSFVHQAGRLENAVVG